MEKGKKLVVMIPAYNEERTIYQVVREIPRKIPGISKVDVLVCNDGSRDRTVEFARAAGAKIFSLPVNKGLGVIFRKGLEIALNMGADIITNIDADRQFNPNDIPRVIRPIVDDMADVVLGSRFLGRHAPRGMPLLKKIGNKMFVNMINNLAKKNFSDTQCGFRAYSRDAILKMNLLGDFTHTHETLLEAINKNLRIREIPVQVVYRRKRRSRMAASLPRYGIRAMGLMMRTFRDHKPLKFFGLPGLFVFGLGFLGALYSFIYWLVTSTTSAIQTLFTVSMLFLIIGFLVIVLAMLADMFRRVKINQEEVLYRLKKSNYKK